MCRPTSEIVHACRIVRLLDALHDSMFSDRARCRNGATGGQRRMELLLIIIIVVFFVFFVFVVAFLIFFSHRFHLVSVRNLSFARRGAAQHIRMCVCACWTRAHARSSRVARNTLRLHRDGDARRACSWHKRHAAPGVKLPWVRSPLARYAFFAASLRRLPVGAEARRAASAACRRVDRDRAVGLQAHV